MRRLTRRMHEQGISGTLNATMGPRIAERRLFQASFDERSNARDTHGVESLLKAPTHARRDTSQIKERARAAAEHLLIAAHREGFCAGFEPSRYQYLVGVGDSDHPLSRLRF